MSEEDPAIRSALEAAAATYAAWDGRDFHAMSRADKKRYVDRFEAAFKAFTSHRFIGSREKDSGDGRG